jgi:hypothetical protein
MGVETPIPPIAMNARRPEGRPAAGIIMVEKKSSIFRVWVRTLCSYPFLQSKKRGLCCTRDQENYAGVPAVTEIGSTSAGNPSGEYASAGSGVKTSILMLPIFPSRRR